MPSSTTFRSGKINNASVLDDILGEMERGPKLAYEKPGMKRKSSSPVVESANNKRTRISDGLPLPTPPPSRSSSAPKKSPPPVLPVIKNKEEPRKSVQKSPESETRRIERLRAEARAKRAAEHTFDFSVLLDLDRVLEQKMEALRREIAAKKRRDRK
uniref:Uncharacterized protein n=1 Tax=Caenorhabditis japonica TaxID=281687 RepID=A0A8R1DT95_CAEJA